MYTPCMFNRQNVLIHFYTILKYANQLIFDKLFFIKKKRKMKFFFHFKFLSRMSVPPFNVRILLKYSKYFNNYTLK